MTTKPKVVLGLSGGVDSAVAAQLLSRDYEVHGLYLDIGLGGTGQADAAAVADRLGIPFHTADIRDALEKQVCGPFAADYLAGLYSSVIHRSLLLASAILHDVAKCEEFNTSPLGLVTEYSVRGQLLGHLVMGAQAVAACAEALGIPEEKSTLLQHLLLSHHGQPEFGAAVVPICAESELLSLIDTMDSRMEIYREVLDQTPAGTCSNRIFALEHRVYHHR